MEVSEKLGEVPPIVANDDVLVIAHRDESMERDRVTLYRLPKTVEIDLRHHLLRPKQMQPLCAAARDQVRAARHDLARHRHRVCPCWCIVAGKAAPGPQCEQANSQASARFPVAWPDRARPLGRSGILRRLRPRPD